MPNTHWVIRVHPGEVVIGNLKARSPIGARVRERYPELPPNVSLIDASSSVNSYALIEISDIVVAYASTIGLEAACMGRPVVVTGDTHHAGCGFTVDVGAREEYVSAVARCLGDPAQVIQVDRALSYAHFYFFRSMIPHDGLFKQGRLFTVTDFVLDDFEALAPGGDPMVDLCCSVILGEAQPVIPDPLLRQHGNPSET